MKKSNLVKNASILMIASIVSRVIGLLYRRPLSAVVGSVGMGYYGFASGLYSILLLISSYSIPMAVSKIISEKNAKREYRSAAKTFRGALLYAVIVGGATALAAENVRRTRRMPCRRCARWRRRSSCRRSSAYTAAISRRIRR